MDQAVLPLQHVACARARPRSAVRHRPWPFQLASPRCPGEREASRLRREPHAFRPYRLPPRVRRLLRPPCRGRDSRRPAGGLDARGPLRHRRHVPAPAEGWDAARYRVPSAPAGRELTDGAILDLGDRVFEVVHTPGHSPGGIGLFERASGIFLSGDVIYDGPLIDDAYHSDLSDYFATMAKLRDLPVSVVHGGHSRASAGRFRQVIEEYCRAPPAPDAIWHDWRAGRSFVLDYPIVEILKPVVIIIRSAGASTPADRGSGWQDCPRVARSPAKDRALAPLKPGVVVASYPWAVWFGGDGEGALKQGPQCPCPSVVMADSASKQKKLQWPWGALLPIRALAQGVRAYISAL